MVLVERHPAGPGQAGHPLEGERPHALAEQQLPAASSTSALTCAAGGIGRAVAERLAADGFAVVVHTAGIMLSPPADADLDA